MSPCLRGDYRARRAAPAAFRRCLLQNRRPTSSVSASSPLTRRPPRHPQAPRAAPRRHTAFRRALRWAAWRPTSPVTGRGRAWQRAAAPSTPAAPCIRLEQRGPGQAIRGHVVDRARVDLFSPPTSISVHGFFRAANAASIAGCASLQSEHQLGLPCNGPTSVDSINMLSAL